MLEPTPPPTNYLPVQLMLLSPGPRKASRGRPRANQAAGAASDAPRCLSFDHAFDPTSTTSCSGRVPAAAAAYQFQFFKQRQQRQRRAPPRQLRLGAAAGPKAAEWTQHLADKLAQKVPSSPHTPAPSDGLRELLRPGPAGQPEGRSPVWSEEEQEAGSTGRDEDVLSGDAQHSESRRQKHSRHGPKHGTDAGRPNPSPSLCRRVPGCVPEAGEPGPASIQLAEAAAAAGGPTSAPPDSWQQQSLDMQKQLEQRERQLEQQLENLEKRLVAPGKRPMDGQQGVPPEKQLQAREKQLQQQLERVASQLQVKADSSPSSARRTIPLQLSPLPRSPDPRLLPAWERRLSLQPRANRGWMPLQEPMHAQAVETAWPDFLEPKAEPIGEMWASERVQAVTLAAAAAAAIFSRERAATLQQAGAAAAGQITKPGRRGLTGCACFLDGRKQRERERRREMLAAAVDGPVSSNRPGAEAGGEAVRAGVPEVRVLRLKDPKSREDLPPRSRRAERAGEARAAQQLWLDQGRVGRRPGDDDDD